MSASFSPMPMPPFPFILPLPSREGVGGGGVDDEIWRGIVRDHRRIEAILRHQPQRRQTPPPAPLPQGEGESGRQGWGAAR
jgi:hypothetical protein